MEASGTLLGFKWSVDRARVFFCVCGSGWEIKYGERKSGGKAD